MEYIILKLPKGKSALLGKILQDDSVSRQTIAVRDAISLGYKGDETYILIEGAVDALKKAETIMGTEGESLQGEKKEDVRTKIKEAEDNVAEGLGFMFG